MEESVYRQAMEALAAQHNPATPPAARAAAYAELESFKKVGFISACVCVNHSVVILCVPLGSDLTPPSIRRSSSRIKNTMISLAISLSSALALPQLLWELIQVRQGSLSETVQQRCFRGALSRWVKRQIISKKALRNYLLILPNVHILNVGLGLWKACWTRGEVLQTERLRSWP
jgi:hypothetical protein